MKTIVHPWVKFLAAVIFLMSGVGNLFAFGATAARMSAIGIPSPSFSLVCAIAVEIVAGAYLLWASKPNTRRARSWNLPSAKSPDGWKFRLAR